MDQICLVIPVISGKSEDARDFMGELEESRKPDYDRSERRIGITKEVWYLAPVPDGDALVAYMESEDFGNVNPPQMELPELLSSYSAAVAVA